MAIPFFFGPADRWDYGNAQDWAGLLKTERKGGPIKNILSTSKVNLRWNK
jgi:hypothetical protein